MTKLSYLLIVNHVFKVYLAASVSVIEQDLDHRHEKQWGHERIFSVCFNQGSMKKSNAQELKMLLLQSK